MLSGVVCCTLLLLHSASEQFSCAFSALCVFLFYFIKGVVLGVPLRVI